MAKYLNLAGLQTLWTKLKDTFALKSHNHNASDINAGTLPIARGGTGATTWQNANEAILGGTAEEENDFGDDSQIICRYVSATANKQRTYYRKTSRIWKYIKSKLGISSAVGSSANPVYVDSNGQLKAVGGTMLKQGSLIDTHSEGSRTILIDGTNELFAFYDRGGTCTAYEYDLEWNSSSPAPAGTFSPADLSSHKTTASVANISANVFNSLTGYNQSTVYSGTKYAVYDLKLPASYSYGTAFYWSFGNSNWKPHYFEVLVWKNNATQYPNGYISKYRSTSVGAYGSVAVGVGATEGNSFTHIRIVMDKYSRLAAFGVVNYASTGLATNYMSRTVDRSLYRNITVAKNNTYDLGSSSAKWANVYSTNFNGALKGNADTASNCNYSGKDDDNTLVVKRTNASGGAFIQYLPNNQTENWWRTGSTQDSSKFVFNYKGTDKAFIDTNGAYNGDVIGNASSASAAKSGSALETAINAKQDKLTAQTAYFAKGSATKVPKITTNPLGQVTNIEEVTITQPDISGKADDNNVVHRTNNENISGVKTLISSDDATSCIDLKNISNRDIANWIRAYQKGNETNITYFGHRNNGDDRDGGIFVRRGDTYKWALSIDGLANVKLANKTSVDGNEFYVNGSGDAGVIVTGKAGTIWLNCNNNATANAKKGLWLPASGSGGDTWMCYGDKDNKCFFKGTSDLAVKANDSDRWCGYKLSLVYTSESNTICFF
ncbi:MAG: hypothetical protein MJY89_06065 [Bacteroidales bacterium]|nr:hypothetical protein [Bacteroidales bacterium]